jgi:hypothetical protein
MEQWIAFWPSYSVAGGSFDKGGKNRCNIATFRLRHTDLSGDKFGGPFSALQFDSKIVGILPAISPSMKTTN